MENYKHNHTKCEHKELKYCLICDIVYCFNPICKEEWKKEKIVYSWINGTTWAGYENTHTINCSYKIN